MIQNGASGSNINMIASFPSSPVIQTKVAKFANVLLSDGVGSNNEKLAVSGIKFGSSLTHCVTMFSRIRLQAPSNMFLNANSMWAFGGSSGAVSTNFNLLSANLDLSQADVINAGAAISIVGLPVNAQFNIAYATFSSKLDNNKIADIAIPGFNAQSPGKETNVSTTVQIVPQDTMPIRRSVLNISKQFLGSRGDASFFGATGLVFGLSNADCIDTFQQVASFPIDGFLYSLAGKGFLSSFSSIIKQAGIKNTSLSVASSSSLFASFQANIGALLPRQVSLNLPFVGFTVVVNNEQFLFLNVQDLNIANNEVTGGATFNFQQNSAFINQVVNAVSYLVVPNIQVPPNFNSSLVGTVTGLAFGASMSSAYGLASQISMTADIQALMKGLSSGGNGFGFAPNINATLLNSGIATEIQIANALIPFPFTNNLGPIRLAFRTM
ncbi:hypothetical protein BC830DRAFT_467283 [Chytriomyces sp. MP71]|nr:hypothetical protein BC830DRAFT_467283 [Chytriomyces sp. MP71]